MISAALKIKQQFAITWKRTILDVCPLSTKTVWVLFVLDSKQAFLVIEHNFSHFVDRPSVWTEHVYIEKRNGPV